MSFGIRGRSVSQRGERVTLREQALQARQAAQLGRESAAAVRQRIELSMLLPRNRLARVHEAREVFMALPVPAAMLDRNGAVTDVNAEWRTGLKTRLDLVEVGSLYGSTWPRPEGGAVL